VDAEVLKGYVLNRAKANNVRAKYEPFFTYMNSMLKIRKEKEYNAYRQVTYEVVRMTRSEFREHFETHGNGALMIGEYSHLDRKGFNEHKTNIVRFMELVQSSDVADFHKAFLCVAITVNGSWGYFMVGDGGVEQRVSSLKDKADEIILMAHAEEVLDEVELPIGKLPNRKYMNWIG
jgi:hypothetical protein